jgi:hypothetical protein
MQLGEFLESDNHNWILAFCKFLPQSEGEWKALGSCPKAPAMQVMRSEGNDSLLRTQKAALHHLVNHLPRLESMLRNHVNSTIPEELGQQLGVLPPILHAAACKSHLKTLPTGRRHLKLDIVSVTVLLAATAVLPQMQGLDSLELTVKLNENSLWCDYQSCPFLSCMTTLKEI